jgi:hypothetical protein
MFMSKEASLFAKIWEYKPLRIPGAMSKGELPLMNFQEQHQKQ